MQCNESIPSSLKTQDIRQCQFDAGGVWEVSEESSSSFLLVKLQAVSLNSEAASSVSNQLTAALDAGAGAEISGGENIFSVSQPNLNCFHRKHQSLWGGIRD